MEDKLIKKAFDSTIKKCLEEPKLAKYEILVQEYLYDELCNEFSKVDPKYPSRIREEYSSYLKKDENKHIPNPKNYWKDTYPKYMEHEKEFNFNGKGGKYDLVLLDAEGKKICHALEVKEISSYSPIHRGYEDIYALSDLLKMHNGEAQGHILIIGWYTSELRGRVTKQKMEEYLNKVHQAYKKAGVHSESVLFDRKLIK